MKEIVYLTGLPASGKTTYRIAEYPNHAVISNDEVTEAYAARHHLNYGEAWQRLSSNDVVREGKKRFEKAVKEGRNIVIDNTNLTVESRALYRAAGYVLKAVVFVISEDQRKQNARHRKASGGKFIDESTVCEMRKKFVLPIKSEGFSEIIYVRQDNAFDA